MPRLFPSSQELTISLLTFPEGLNTVLGTERFKNQVKGGFQTCLSGNVLNSVIVVLFLTCIYCETTQSYSPFK